MRISSAGPVFNSVVDNLLKEIRDAIEVFYIVKRAFSKVYKLAGINLPVFENSIIPMSSYSPSNANNFF